MWARRRQRSFPQSLSSSKAIKVTTPKLLDVEGGPLPVLEIAPTPEQFAERLQTAEFSLASDAALALDTYTKYWLSNGVGGRARLALRMQQEAASARQNRLLLNVVLFAGVPAVLFSLVAYDAVPSAAL